MRFTNRLTNTDKYRLTDRQTDSHITDAVYEQTDKHTDKYRLTDRQTDSHITDAVYAGSERKLDLLVHNFHTCPGHLMRHKLFQSAGYYTLTQCTI